MQLLSKNTLEALYCSEPFRDFLADIGSLGVTSVHHGGLRYSVIKARSNPRWWLLPQDERRAAAAGLEMLQPVTRAAKAAKAFARALARIGALQLLGQEQLRLSGVPDLNQAFGGYGTHVAYFTGTDGPHRKTTLQVMDANGGILGYAKLSRSAHVRPYLRNEARVLAHVAGLGLRSADIPKVLATRDDGTVTLLITDGLKSAAHSAPLVPQVEHMAFLEEMRARTERLGAHETLDELMAKVSALKEMAGPDWNARLARVEALLRPRAEGIPVCMTHGDFTPWNSFLQGNRLYVFDWEYAQPAWPVGFDLAHFHLATTPPARQPDSVPNLTQALARAHFGGDLGRGRDALLLSLACHAVFYLGRLGETNYPLTDWNDGVARAAMIDRLLATETTSST